MTDNVFGERFYGTRKPAWNGLGKVFEKAISPVQAVKEISMDYTVDKYPLSATLAGKKTFTGKFGIFRSPTADDPEWRYFGSVGENYEIIQNVDLASIMEPLAAVWPLETMGALDNGKCIFMAFNTGGANIEGDPIEGYFTLVNQQDGGHTVKLVYTPVRVVCKNTLITGLARATVSLQVQHQKGASAMIAARTNLIAKAQTAIDDTTMIFRQLAIKKVTKAQAENVFNKVYPNPRMSDDLALKDYSKEDLGELLFADVQETASVFQARMEKAERNRTLSMQLFNKLNDEYPALGNTAWHAYNAVVEYADFRGKSSEAADTSAFIGYRSKEKEFAFKAVQNLK